MRGRTVVSAAFMVLLGVACAGSAPAADGAVRGRVASAGQGVADIAVEIYLQEKKGLGGTPFAVTRTGGDGGFAIELPPGDYYFWAREEAPLFGPPRVSEYGQNPVVVKKGARTILEDLVLREVGGAAAAVPGTGIRGRAVIGPDPAADVTVMIYDGARAELKGPGYAAMAVTDAEGRFEADLAAGSYSVALRKRRGGGMGGFLGEGDHSGEYKGNPVAVVEGSYLDLGDVSLHAVDPGKLARETETRQKGPGTAVLGGRVKGTDGKPLGGQYVFLYRDGGMIGRPAAVTTSGPDGLFRFALGESGTWYVGARGSMGGPRQPGEMVGRLTGSADSSVTVTDGEERRDLVIVMEAQW